MNKTEILLAAEFSMDEVKDACSREASILAEAEFGPEEINSTIKKRYGLSVIPRLDSEERAMMCVQDVVQSALKLEKAPEKTTQNEKEANTPKPSEYNLFGGAPTIFGNDIEKLAPNLKDSWNKGVEDLKEAKEEAGDALLAGWQASTTGLATRGKLPDKGLSIDPGLLEQTFYTLGQAVGDIPTYAAGALIGTTTANPIGIGAAAFATTEGARAYMMDLYKNGEATNGKEVMERMSATFTAAGKGALVGAVSTAGGLLFAKGATGIINSTATNAMATALKAKPTTAIAGAGLVGEELGSTIASSAIEGEMPKLQDFIVSGITLATFKAGAYYSDATASAITRTAPKAAKVLPGLSKLYRDRFMDLYAKTGKTPQQVMDITILDPKSRVNMASINYQPASKAVMPEMKSANKETSKFLKGTRLFTTDEGVDTKTKKSYKVLSTAGKAQTDLYKAQRLEAEAAGKEGRAEREIKEYILDDKADVIQMNNKTMLSTFQKFLETDAGEEFMWSTYSPEDLTKAKTDPKFAKGLAREMFEDPSPEFLDFLRMDYDLYFKSGFLSDNGKDPLDSTLSYGTPEYQAAMSKRQGIFNEYFKKTKGATALKMEDGSYIVIQPDKVKEAKEIPLKNLVFAKGKVVSARDITLDEAKKDIRKYLDFDKRPRKTWKEIKDTFTFHMVDRFRALNDGAEPGKMNIAYFAAHRTNFDSSIAESIIRRHRTKWDTDEVVEGKTLQEIIMSVPDKQDFSIYLTARKQIELYNRGEKENLLAIPIDKAKVVVNEFDKNPEYKQAAKDLDDYMDYLKEYAKDAGLISEKSLAKYREENVTKAPIHTVPDFLIPVLENDKATTKAVLGSLGVKDKDVNYKYYDDPLVSAVGLTYSVVSSALKNEAMKMAAYQFGMPIDKPGASDVVKISYFENGKHQARMVPKEIARAAYSMSPENTKLFGSFYGKTVLSKATRIANAGAVLMWDFMAKSTFIDQFTAGIQSKTGYVPFVDMFKGFAASISHMTNGKLFKNYEGIVDEWWRSGGYNAGIVAADRNSAKAVLRDLTRPSALNVIKDPAKHYKDILRLLNVPGHGLNFLRGVSEQLDRATRLGEYINAKNKGYSPQEAAMLARDVTTDYKRMGATGQAVNQLVAFFNATIQGNDKLVRTFMDDPKTAAIRTAMYVGIPSFLLALVRADIEENSPESDMAMVLKSVPEWQKQAYWIIPTGSSVLRIPKPHGYLIQGALIESLTSFMVQKDRGLLDALYNEGFIESVSRTFIPDVMPTALKPVIETKTNYRFFSDGPIIPMSAENLVNEEQYTMGTSETAKIIGRFFADVDTKMGLPLFDRLSSPLVIDNVIRSYTSSLGVKAVEWLDNSLRAAGIVKHQEPAKSLEDMPLFKTFMYKFGPHAKQIQDFYAKEKELTKVYNTVRKLASSPDPAARARAQKMMNRPFANLRNITNVNNTISKVITATYYSPDLTPEEKAVAINEHYKRKVMVCIRGLEIIKQIEQSFEER